MRVELPILLALAPVVALAVAGLARWAESRRIGLAAAWSAELGTVARRGRLLSVPLLALAVVVAGLGAAGPRGGRAERLSEGRGLNVLLAVDVSRSMLAEDMAPSRLRHAVGEARRLLQDVPRDRVGVVAFAGQSYVLAPLTLDHAAVAMYLEALDPDIASTGGTSLGAVLRQGLQVLDASLEGGDRALVLFTDGETHDPVDDALAAARELRDAGVRLVLVAQGGELPVRIPLRDLSGALAGYKRDAAGEVVETRRRDDVLRQLATEADGVLVAAGVPDQAGAVRDELAGLVRRPVRERRLADLRPLGWIAGLAAALLLLGQTASRRTAALVGLAGLLLAPPAQAQGAGTGDRLAAEGRLAEAAAAYRRDALQGRGGDTAWYNAGAAALAAGRLDEAREALERALGALDPDLRFRTLYNLGLTDLLAARADPAGRAEREGSAAARFRAALLLRPGSMGAKWNLELLERPPPPPTRGGGGGAEAERASASGSGMSDDEAAALLASVERGELATRMNALRRQRVRSAAAGKDW